MMDVSSASAQADSRVLWLDQTLPSAEENLALDEALLEACDAGELPATLRFWEPQGPFVVVGYSNSIGSEVDRAACQRAGIQILRRCTGGGTVVQMPGVLNYNWVSFIPESGPLATLAGTNAWVMKRVREALSTLPGMGGRLSIRGTTDLCLDHQKCIGSAQRRKKNALVFHGSILLDAKLGLLESVLRMPTKQPEYRAGRSHQDFCINLQLDSQSVKAALKERFGASATHRTAMQQRHVEVLR